MGELVEGDDNMVRCDRQFRVIMQTEVTQSFGTFETGRHRLIRLEGFGV